MVSVYSVCGWEISFTTGFGLTTVGSISCLSISFFGVGPLMTNLKPTGRLDTISGFLLSSSATVIPYFLAMPNLVSLGATTWIIVLSELLSEVVIFCSAGFAGPLTSGTVTPFKLGI